MADSANRFLAHSIFSMSDGRVEWKVHMIHRGLLADKPRQTGPSARGAIFS
jgi:hypothetical protein